jgi:hypothetical protein
MRNELPTMRSKAILILRRAEGPSRRMRATAQRLSHDADRWQSGVLI